MCVAVCVHLSWCVFLSAASVLSQSILLINALHSRGNCSFPLTSLHRSEGRTPWVCECVCVCCGVFVACVCECKVKLYNGAVSVSVMKDTEPLPSCSKFTQIHTRAQKTTTTHCTDTHRESEGGRERVCVFMLPDAAHAASLRSQFASLQLCGYNLTLSLKFPCQAFKLKLLGR